MTKFGYDCNMWAEDCATCNMKYISLCHGQGDNEGEYDKGCFSEFITSLMDKINEKIEVGEVNREYVDSILMIANAICEDGSVQNYGAFERLEESLEGYLENRRDIESKLYNELWNEWRIERENEGKGIIKDFNIG